MTALQIVIIVAGLVVGYKLVSLMLSPGTGDDRSHPPRSSTNGPRVDNQSTQSDAAGSGGPPPPSASAWYQTLGVAGSASVDEIERAYRVQISQYHPDKVAKLGEDIRHLAEARSKEINAAYDTAMKRQRY